MACKSISLSCFYTQYFIVFSVLVVLANLSCCFGGLVQTIGKLVILSSASWVITKCIRKKLNKELISSYKKAVLITGCDSGFGNRLALKMNEHGYKVYATVLDPMSPGSQQLTTNARFSNKTKVLKMDVTNDEEINKIYEEVENDLNNNGEQLWAIVNNSGIGSLGRFDWGTLDTYKRIFDVNTFGTVRVARTFLPLIRKSKGRIVNVVSLAGRITDSKFTPYCMSKHAVISFSDALRREMREWGVKVSTIEPGFYKTPMVTEDSMIQALNKEWAETSEDVKQVYGQQHVESTKDELKKIVASAGNDIEQVIDKMVDAIRSQEPQIRYQVVSDCKLNLLKTLAEYIPMEWLDQMIYFEHRKVSKPAQLRA